MEIPKTKHVSAIFKYRQELKEARRAGETERLETLLRHKKSEQASQEAESKQKIDQKDDPFKGPVPVSGKVRRKYHQGKLDKKAGHFRETNLKSARLKSRKQKQISKIGTSVYQSAKAEFILPEQAGILEADEGETTADIRQSDIAEAVDVQSAQKYFSLTMKDFGPYSIAYSHNGRHLALAGTGGHAAVIDWQPKKLMCEFNVQETASDVCWLHNETMFAVAQRQWLYIYDNQGIELHCLKAFDCPLQLQFLQYHFLLVAASSKGFLQYMDASVGKAVAGIKTHRGRLGVMSQNKTNAIIHLGHARGTVSLWSPNSTSGPLVEILAHKAAVRSIAVDKSGVYMATSGMDRKVKVWDLRTYKCLHEFKVKAGASTLEFSDRGLLAAGISDMVEVYQDTINKPPEEVYLSHRAQGMVRQVQFCPFEDVLGVGSGGGFESLLIPGAGEPNFDALEANPFQSRKQRQSAEVKMLLDKIPYQMITINKDSLTVVKDPTAQLPSEFSKPKSKEQKKVTQIPSKSQLELMRRERVKEQINQREKDKRQKKHKQQQETNKKEYDPLDRFTSNDD